ncbi:MAG TPA: zinc-binding alcohol dehydrogenase family protein [Bryobacteraceae bacterium]|jgi:2-desacetyl-2-hydroxyethyl bacteriochlorophyllide A dehydrogenase|nr:zinc-binding alcohol dehydrogenase family protein [Bryobacteraceae bacterium]HVW06947.1 zinc-binding alcohol dehydrogenase family protein [Bryobacteraceae bacterium]
MRQIILEQPGSFAERSVEPPLAAPGEALVSIRRIGICGTDLHAFAGRQPFFEYPRVLGHELGVEVLEAPPNDRGISAGDRCAVEPYVNCGECRACRRGLSNCCERIQVLGVHRDGGMQEIFSVPVRLLHKSEKLTLDQLALVETLGIGAHAVARARLGADDEALIVGAGPIGLAVFSFARLTGAKVRLLDVSAERRGFAQRFGAETVASAGGQLADVVFDATGNRSSMEACFQLVAHGGRIVFVGLVQGAITFDDPNFHRRETTLLATRNSCGDFPRIIRLIEEGGVDTGPWITHHLSLADVPRRFEEVKSSPDLIKAVIEVNANA